MALTGITVDIKSLSKAFYQARKEIPLGVQRALQASGKPLLDEVKANAPKRRPRLSNKLKFQVVYNAGSASLSIIANDPIVQKYFMIREEGGSMQGKPEMAFVPEFSPFFSYTATIRSAEQKARSAGYTYFFRPPGTNVLLGVKHKKSAGRGKKWNKTADQFAPIAIFLEKVTQTGEPYIQPAFDSQSQDIQQRIIDEITKVFNK